MATIFSAMLLFFLFACTNNQPTTANQQVVGKGSVGPVDGDTTQSESSQITGEEFFQSRVVEAFNPCERCHAGPEIPVERDRGPTTLFEYEPMKAMLNSNTLIPMLRNRISERPHPNNDPCLADLNSSPCREVVEWWEIEFGDDPSKEKDRPLTSLGAVVSISADGIVSGWAINPRDKSETVTVKFSIGDVDLNPLEANQDIFDNSNDGAHGFQFQLDQIYRDGQSFQLVAMITLDGQDHELSGSPFDFAALEKNPAGRTFFDDTVRPLLSANCGCHGNSLTYDYSWIRLANPLVTNNGSSTNNVLHRKASGQIQHSGGNSCNNNAACDRISEWWSIEFGGINP